MLLAIELPVEIKLKKVGRERSEKREDVPMEVGLGITHLVGRERN